MLHNILRYAIDCVPESVEFTLSMLHVFRGLCSLRGDWLRDENLQIFWLYLLGMVSFIS